MHLPSWTGMMTDVDGHSAPKRRRRALLGVKAALMLASHESGAPDCAHPGALQTQPPHWAAAEPDLTATLISQALGSPGFFQGPTPFNLCLIFLQARPRRRGRAATI